MILEVLLCTVIALVLFAFGKKRIPEGFPPGEEGWPIIGYAPAYSVPVADHIKNSIKKYGKIFTWCAGGKPRVLLCEYKALKVAFNSPNLDNKLPIFSLDFFSNFKKLGLVNSSGIKFRNVRRFTISYLKDRGMGKSSLEQVITHETLCLLKELEKQVDKTITVPWSINAAVLNVLWGIVTGQRHELHDKKIQGLIKLISDMGLDLQSPPSLIYSTFPWLSQLIPHVVKGYLGLGSAFARANTLQHFLMEVLQQHKESLDENNPVDYIDSYLIELKKHKENRGHENTNTFTEEELVNVSRDLFIIGSGTIAATMRWILIYMIKYPEIQLKVQQQIDEVVPRDRLPCLQDRDKLPYFDATLYEVMRIKPLLPFGTAHVTSDDMDIENFHITKGTSVVPGIGACHYDPDYWDQPCEFNPDRFILPDGSFNGKKDGYLPFGTGRRSCPGESLAKMELYLIGSALLQKFSFSSPEVVDEILKPNNGIALINIPRPFKVILKERI